MDDRSVGSVATALDEQIVAEHARIRDLNHQLQACEDVPELLRIATELRAFLVHHFVTESGPNGYFETVRQMAPQHRRRLDQLEAEHTTFLADLGALANRAMQCLGEIASLRGDAREIGLRLEAHEHAEDHLIIDAVDTDLGQSG